jgi:hypothetical protein
MDSDGDGDAVGGGGEDGPTDGVAARASCRTIKNRPVPISSNTALPKINGSDHRRWVLIMWGSTQAPYPSQHQLVSGLDDHKSITWQ